MCAGWTPKAFTLREVCLTLRLPHSWIDSPRYKLLTWLANADRLNIMAVGIDFPGPTAQPNEYLVAFMLTCIHLNALTAFSFSPII